jgi:hypothetical protein
MVAPQPHWKELGRNEWAIYEYNVWLKRYYDGQFIRDDMRRIK